MQIKLIISYELIFFYFSVQYSQMFVQPSMCNEKMVLLCAQGITYLAFIWKESSTSDILLCRINNRGNTEHAEILDTNKEQKNVK